MSIFGGDISTNVQVSKRYDTDNADVTNLRKYANKNPETDAHLGAVATALFDSVKANAQIAKLESSKDKTSDKKKLERKYQSLKERAKNLKEDATRRSPCEKLTNALSHPVTLLAVGYGARTFEAMSLTVNKAANIACAYLPSIVCAIGSAVTSAATGTWSATNGNPNVGTFVFPNGTAIEATYNQTVF